MERKFIAILLAISMLFCMLVGCSKTESMITEVVIDGFEITIEETKAKRTASTTVEDIPVKCEYLIDTDEYWLYLTEEPIQLKVNVLDNGAVEILTCSEWDEYHEDEVVGQFALTASIASSTAILSAKTLICALIGVTVTSRVFVSADAIGNVIGGIRYNTKTYYKYRQIDMAAADAIRLGRMNRNNAYFTAMLKNNTVMVGMKISQTEAVRRLEFGQDVFATSAFAAGYVCLQASTVRGKDIPNHQATNEGFFPHYHPLGRRWVQNRLFAPHCWYPY